MSAADFEFAGVRHDEVIGRNQTPAGPSIEAAAGKNFSFVHGSIEHSSFDGGETAYNQIFRIQLRLRQIAVGFWTSNWTRRSGLGSV